MREIRFRGWHVSAKKMFSADEMATDQLTLLTTGSFINVHGSLTQLSTIFDRHKFIPMQFTGLLDKNGKEIYEFDILCFEGKYHYQVVYQDAKFVCLHAVKSNTMSGTLWGALHRFFDPDFMVYGGVEVIGNKFENPELLTP